MASEGLPKYRNECLGDSMIQFFFDHIVQLIPILACGVFAAAIIFERFYALFFTYPILRSRGFFDKVRTLVVSDRIAEAVSFCERYGKKPVARIVKEGLLRAHQPESILQHGLEIEVGENIDRIKARTSFLSTLANVSTLFGLIGTIMGLIQAFEAVGSANIQTRSALLSQGISTAMNHTLWGLVVAVPCMIFYSFLTNRTNRLRSEFERTAVRTIDIIQQRYVIASEFYQNDAAEGKRAG